MHTSIKSDTVRVAIREAKEPTEKTVRVASNPISIPAPFCSPADWRDVWIYQILLDRFNNPSKPPISDWDRECTVFQGGNFEGVRKQLGYLQSIGAGAIWISPCMKNCQYLPGTYHGYGIQDFLRLDPRFASTAGKEEEEFRALVDEAHARGIYVIADIVLNHVGDVFQYVCDGDKQCIASDGHEADWRSKPYAICWRDETGQGRPEWPEPPKNTPASSDGLVWPIELQNNDFFRRQGKGGEKGGDFCSLREMVTALPSVRDTLIHAHQYFVAKYDVDGFRIDTLKFIEPDFARIFGNAMREFGLSIGKKNFFTFGEIWDSEEIIAKFIGRNATRDDSSVVGVDAALDFPLAGILPSVVKGFEVPARLVGMFEHRKYIERGIVSSHGDASRYFVTFLDNHDFKRRFRTGQGHEYDDQITMGLACLFSLQGIPCVYYGTEQGLNGTQEVYDPAYSDEKTWADWMVRESLWGKPNAFDLQNPFAVALRKLTEIRRDNPALRYGRQYFRPLSGDGKYFGISPFPGGIMAFSRILNDDEILVIANAHTENEWEGHVIIDSALHQAGNQFQILFSNKSKPSTPKPVEFKYNTEVHEPEGGTNRGQVTAISVSLKPMEIQILSKLM